MKEENRGTIKGMRLLGKIWPLDGFKVTKTARNLQKFLDPEEYPKVIYTGNSFEFGKTCEDLRWNHCASTPHRSEMNGLGETVVRRVN